MSESEHLSEAIADFYGKPDNGWFVPITESVKGLSAEQAASVPARRFNSIWAVVNHVRLCQEVVLLRLQGKTVDRKALGAEDDWPPVVDPMDESAWEAACQRAAQINRELSEEVAKLTEEDLAEPYEKDKAEKWKLVLGTLAHNSYHACEIISIRHMQGMWLAEV